MSNTRWRHGIQIAILVALIGAGVTRIVRGDAASGWSFLISSLGALTVTTVLRRSRTRRSTEAGTVPYDERNVENAGRAALFTVRAVLGVLTVAMLLLFAAGPDWRLPVIVPVGGTLFMLSLVLRVSYWHMERH